MFRIKICGITSIADATAAIEVGADALGFNFYESSRRYIAPEMASEIIKQLPGEVTAVGLFVNSPADSIHQICKQVGLATVQLHGDERPDFLGKLDSSLSIVRAIRVSDDAIEIVKKDREQCLEQSGIAPTAVLLDAAAPGQYGGTGKSLTWEDLIGWDSQFSCTPLILAGGLNPENVAEAIQIVQPHGVDVASGVEVSPGVKDRSQVRLFVERAQQAFAEIGH